MDFNNFYNMTHSIELFDVRIEDDRIVADYAIYDDEGEANIEQHIRPSHLADFILEEQLNWIETEPGEFVECGVTMFMIENLRDMVKLYIERRLLNAS